VASPGFGATGLLGRGAEYDAPQMPMGWKMGVWRSDISPPRAKSGAEPLPKSAF